MQVEADPSEVIGKPKRRILSNRFRSLTGKENIYVRRSIPYFEKSGAKTHIIIVHGACEYHGRHQNLPKYLTDRFGDNVVFTWVDLKGHGLSTGPRSHVESFEEFSLDLVHVINENIQDLVGDVEHTYLFGHSMGGLVVLETLLNYSNNIEVDLKGCILSNPCLRPQIETPLWLNKGLESTGPLLSKLRVMSLYNGYDLCRDKVYAREFNSDQLISHYMTVGLLKALMKSSKRVRQLAYYIKTPMLFLLSGEDKIVSSEFTKLFARGISKELCTVQNYPDMFHEIFNDLGREIACEDVYNWIINENKKGQDEIS